MRPRRSTLAIGILAALIGSAVHAESSDVQAQLVAQGQYWQARKNEQRAAEVWQKVLLLNPNQPDALYGMGLIGVRENKPQQAQDYLARLQALSPVPWQARQLQQDIALARPENKALFEEARRLADAGQRDQATDVFRRMFNGLTPEGEVGREYYNNLAFSDAGWPEARRGMERLLRETPDDSILALFYAKQLIRHEDTRVQGIDLLAKLTKRVDIAGDADESWRLALVWMGPPKPAQVPLFETFLKAHPDDQEIRDQMNKGIRQASGGQQNPLVASGLQALQKGDQAAAEQAFRQRLATAPNDPDALGGLGVLRQQQNRYAEAEQLLDRAISHGGSHWRSALDSVRYWALLQQGRDLQAKGQTAQAEQMVERAMRLDPKDFNGRLALADIQAQGGQLGDAEANYRQVLAAQPGNPAAVRGLINVLSQTGQADEALRLLDSLSPAEQAKFGNAARLHALRDTQLAAAAEQRGDLPGAQAALRDAIKNDPDNVWTRFSLARLYVKLGQPQKARELIDGFIATHPGNVDALYTSALLSVQMGQWKDAQAALDRIPIERRSADMNDLADQITLSTQIDLAVSLAKSGQRQDAEALLDRLQPMTDGRPERIATLAAAYADAGDPARAQAMMQPLVAPSAAPSSDLMLQYASILLKTGDDAQVQAILLDLQHQPLSTATRKRYDDLLYLYRVRQADRLREGGDLAAAYDMLAPALATHPGDVAANSALARMYTANGDHAKALGLYKSLLRRNQQDAALLLAAADAAVLAHDDRFAGEALDHFSGLQDVDPASLTEAARIYRAMGRSSEAAALLRRAIALEQSERQRGLAAVDGAWHVASNPFRNQPGQRGQVLSIAASAVPPPADAILRRGTVATAAADGVPAHSYRDGQADAVGGQDEVWRSAASQVPPAVMLRTAAAPALRPSASAAASTDDPFAPQPRAAATTSMSASTSAPATGDASAAQQALNDLLQSRSGYMHQGVDIRSNDSEPGLSKLTDVETPFEINIPAGDGRLAARITPVTLDAGSMSDDSARRFGGGASSAAGAGKQRDEGVGIGLAYARPDDGLKADVGTTPLGFQYSTAVGGVSVERPVEGDPDVRYGVSLSRRVVTDSLTSFAGTTDGRDGKSWGGVTATGGRLQLSYDDADVGAYAYGSVHRLLGHNVESNTRVEVGGGVYRYLQNDPDDKLTAGLSTTVLGYANNQDFFTYGNGGYFSPQSYFALGVPVALAQRSDRFTYQVKGSVGIQYFDQDGADYFPTDAAMQAASGQRYAEQSKSGVGYSLEAAGEYRFGPRLFVGGTFALDNSRDYRQYNVGMYVRYTFEDMTGSTLALPVSPYRSPYSN